jgi:hypothetical protein
VDAFSRFTLAGDLERDVVAEAIKRDDLDPDATTEVP